MQLEVGTILEGKVTGITKFGAFVELEPGTTGMVHISEVASSYVKEISDHLELGQVVKVKIIGVTPEGKISLSIKQAAPPSAQQNNPSQRYAPRHGGQFQGGQQRQGGGQFQGGSRQGGGMDRAPRQRRAPREVSFGFDKRQPISSDTMSFEDMMSKFKQASDDKISDLKKYTDVKHGTTRRR